MTLSPHAQRVAAAKAKAQTVNPTPTNPDPNTTATSDPNPADPTGRTALEGVLGKNNLAAGENLANSLIPKTAAQIDATPSAATTGATNVLNQNVQPDANTTSALDTQRQNTLRSAAQSDVLDRQKDIATQGLSAKEFQGQRDQLNQGLNSTTATTQANLAKAQAQGKVYGAAGVAQRANALNADATTRANNEQQLFLQSEALKRSGLQDYSNTLNTQNSQLATNANSFATSAETSQQNAQTRGTQAAAQVNTNTANTTDINKFNIGEQDANIASKLGAITNVAGIGATKDINEQMVALDHDAIAAAGGRTSLLDKTTAQNKKVQNQTKTAKNNAKGKKK